MVMQIGAVAAADIAAVADVATNAESAFCDGF